MPEPRYISVRTAAARLGFKTDSPLRTHIRHGDVRVYYPRDPDGVEMLDFPLVCVDDLPTIKSLPPRRPGPPKK